MPADASRSNTCRAGAGTDQPGRARASASPEAALALNRRLWRSHRIEVPIFAFNDSKVVAFPLNGLTLNDNKLGAIALDRTTLLPGETAVGSASHQIVACSVRTK